MSLFLKHHLNTILMIFSVLVILPFFGCHSINICLFTLKNHECISVKKKQMERHSHFDRG